AGHELNLHVAADGFLRNMVRTIGGTLLWVGKGKLTPDDVRDVLQSRDRERAGHNGGPQGPYSVEGRHTPREPPASEAYVARVPPNVYSGMAATHLQDGRPVMVDVSGKQPTRRTAVAESVLRLTPATAARLQEGGEKGDALFTAELAGVMGAKRASELIPLCH